jgi:RNA-directed DNA polymerase
MADPHSYGFRKKRSIHDAIGATFNALRLKGSPQWILEGDIRGCFDRISHKWMLENIPMNKRKLKLWLKSGFMEKGVFHPTEEGTPQGALCKALHKPPYAKLKIMQSKLLRLPDFQCFFRIYFA